MDTFTLVCKKFYTEYHHLLMQAKRLANDSVATVVLISSEGTVVPIIQWQRIKRKGKE